MVFRQKGPLVVTAWLDSKVVTVMSTNGQPGEVTTTLRRLKDGTRAEFPCASSVVSYSANMGGIDRNDQLRQYYNVRTKSHKPYKYMFWFCIELCIANTFILCRQYSRPELDMKTCRMELAKKLIGSYNSRKRAGRPSSQQQTVQQQPMHFPKKIKKDGCTVSRRCQRCFEKGIRKDTTWCCLQCGMNLCLTGEDDGSDCFQLYHQCFWLYNFVTCSCI